MPDEIEFIPQPIRAPAEDVGGRVATPTLEAERRVPVRWM